MLIIDNRGKKIWEKATKKASAIAHKCLSYFVGVVGFELTTSWSQTRHTNRTVLHPAVLFLSKRLQRYSIVL